MRTLFHLWLDPACRKIRLILGEKGLDFQMKVEKIWERREDFLALSPSGRRLLVVNTPDNRLEVFGVGGGLGHRSFLATSAIAVTGRWRTLLTTILLGRHGSAMSIGLLFSGALQSRQRTAQLHV